MVECLMCGAVIQDGRWARKYCDKRCRHLHWSKNNRERIRAWSKKWKAKQLPGYRSGGVGGANRDWVQLLKSQPCVDCGGTFPTCCMDFDHRPGTKKTNNVGTMVSHHWSREMIENEIAKCDLVCSNCHRIRTRSRRLGQRKPATTGLSALPQNAEA